MPIRWSRLSAARLRLRTVFPSAIEEFESPDHIFSDYAYFSSYSESWLRHAKTYVDMAVQRFHLDRGSQVIEIASNDGYLLRNFVDKQIPALGIEPAANVAKVAVEKGIRRW